MQNSKIEWTDHTFNPWWGCVKVSPGCQHCYAETLAHRYGHDVWGPAKTTSRRGMSANYWKQPLKWNKQAHADGVRRRVFCASMADVFEDHPGVVEWRAELFALIEQTPALDWLLLTKRPEHMPRFAPAHWAGGWPVNVWAMTSVEDQEQAEKRTPLLLQVPARVRGLSCEPLLGPVNVARWLCCPWCGDGDRARQDLNGTWYHENDGWARPCPTTSRGPAVHTIDWVIVGGESGRAARPMHPDWARSLRDQCQAAGVAYHFKQWGEYKPSPWVPEPNAKPHFALAVEHDGSHVYAQVGHIAGFRSPTEVCMERVGKHAAGRVLDGRTWDEVPHGH